MAIAVERVATGASFTVPTGSRRLVAIQKDDGTFIRSRAERYLSSSYTDTETITNRVRLGDVLLDGATITNNFDSGTDNTAGDDITLHLYLSDDI